jgi:hypothetical protein
MEPSRFAGFSRKGTDCDLTTMDTDARWAPTGADMGVVKAIGRRLWIASIRSGRQAIGG